MLKPRVFTSAKAEPRDRGADRFARPAGARRGQRAQREGHWGRKELENVWAPAGTICNQRLITMKTAILLASFLGSLIDPTLARAGFVYEHCGPRGTGFIKVGGQRTCIFRPVEDPAPGSATGGGGSRTEPAAEAGANVNVDQNLNSADLSFRDGEKQTACLWVRNAIDASTDYKGKSTASENQRQQLRKYANRCNLRY